MPNAQEILEKLISFDTTSRNPNSELMDYVTDLLARYGITSTRIPNSDGSKANLYCTVGPQDKPGVMLSGHTDVVPVEGQAWTYPPFAMTENDGKLYGRGTADMKGFVACALNAAISASQCKLNTPLHLAFSYDEEIGCVGVHSLLTLLNNSPVKPAMCIVGEPTSLQVATRHKGKTSILARCIGKEGHSALAPNALNAIHIACELVTAIKAKQEKIIAEYSGDEALTDVPFTTIHVGRIVTDQALNIVPNLCTVNFEIRHTEHDNPTDILNELNQTADTIVARYRQQAPEAAIEFDVWNAYPGLNTEGTTPVVDFVKSLVGANTTSYVAFGTEGGLFSNNCGIPTVVCGPGSMEQGHKPDEFIAVSQLHACEAMLGKLVDYLGTESLPQ